MLEEEEEGRKRTSKWVNMYEKAGAKVDKVMEEGRKQ